MKRWVIVAQLRGKYIGVNEDNEEFSHFGPSLYLGVGRGETVDEAFGLMAERQGLNYNLADIKHAKIFGYECIGEGQDINFKKSGKLADEHYGLKNENSKYEDKKCEWCQDTLPSNGAAQFSHLRKHVSQLQKMKLLSDQDVKEIRSIKLTSEIRKRFVLGVAQKAFK